MTGTKDVLRHPSETGLLLASVGFTVMLSAWQTAMILLPIALAFSMCRMQLEEHWLLAVFGAEYRDYCHRTGRWIPNLKGIHVSKSNPGIIPLNEEVGAAGPDQPKRQTLARNWAPLRSLLLPTFDAIQQRCHNWRFLVDAKFRIERNDQCLT